MSAAQKKRNVVHMSMVLLAGLVAAGCSASSSGPGGSESDGGADAAGEGGGSSGGAATTVAGTVTLPADATGRCVMVALDDDTTGSNASARRGDGTYLLSYQRVTGRSVSFTFDGAPPGAYFLWAFVDADASSSSASGDCEITGGPSTGDHLGYYDTGLSPPNAPNVSVPHATGQRYDFQLGVFP